MTTNEYICTICPKYAEQYAIKVNAANKTIARKIAEQDFRNSRQHGGATIRIDLIPREDVQ